MVTTTLHSDDFRDDYPHPIQAKSSVFFLIPTKQLFMSDVKLLFPDTFFRPSQVMG